MAIQDKQLYYFLAVKEILELFAEQEIGSSCEIDIQAVSKYIQSNKFFMDTFEIKSKEEIYKLVTDDILAGYPVWVLLKMSDWTRNMVIREFTKKREEAIEKLKKTYKCYTCKWHVIEVFESAGTFEKCERPRDRFEIKRREVFEPKKRCKYYEKED